MGINLELVKAAKNGDKESFAQVYDHYAPDLYRVALYTLGSTFDAEDVVSESFIEAFKGIKNLRELTKIKSWLMTILSARCKRKIKEYIRRRQQSDIYELIPTIADRSDFSIDSIQKKDILTALESLTNEERLIISLSTIQGYTVKETSHIINMRQGTVSSKLYRALDKLRKILPENY